MKNNLFRKSSIDRISSPDQLNDYIQVVTPGVWLILSAILVLLAGMGIWSVFGQIESSQNALLLVKDGTATCYIGTQQRDAVHEGQLIRTDIGEGKILSVSEQPVEITEGFDSYAGYVGGFQKGDWYYTAQVEFGGQDGAFMSKIITDSISPISFLLN